eukprot:TRINITY_DN436_c0_g1_i1.p2 TRINITY_DN436_c0_g1~~TRINITY_DN436_c0_g1_i1.p2  ORF type:complete len:132 (-),score=64.20 TRINITY_DN436_c0_g1_i1:54-404(-)
MSSSSELTNEQEVLQVFNRLRQDIQNLSTKIGELEVERSEHNLVIETITPLEPARTCYRLVGGTLVQRTVGEVLPAVQKNRDNLSEVLEQLTKSITEKESELAAFTAKYKIKIVEK